MKITSKGQVTIPQHLRKRAGLMPGCDVEFVEGKNGQISIRKLAGASRGRGIVEGLRGRGSVKMTTDEILKLTRGR
jgi:AbrB family looped-hinge helix DNA binding protein